MNKYAIPPQYATLLHQLSFKTINLKVSPYRKQGESESRRHNPHPYLDEMICAYTISCYFVYDS